MTADPSCNKEAVLPCGKINTEPRFGITPRATNDVFVFVAVTGFADVDVDVSLLLSLFEVDDVDGDVVVIG